MTEENSRFKALVKEEKRLIEEEIERKYKRFRNDDGLFRLDRNDLMKHGRDIINYLIDDLAKRRASKYITEKARQLS